MTYTEQLRERVLARVSACPTCHQSLPGAARSDREVAERIGISYTTLWRFLRGMSPSGDTIDAIEAWLEREPVAEAVPA